MDNGPSSITLVRLCSRIFSEIDRYLCIVAHFL